MSRDKESQMMLEREGMKRERERKYMIFGTKKKG